VYRGSLVQQYPIFGWFLHNSANIPIDKTNTKSSIENMNNLAPFLGFIGPWQIGLIIVIVLLLFGGKKIPELMKGLGSGIKEFKNAAKEDQPADKKEEDKKE
jgi:sec-independent protein translocase protein TatA